MLSYVLAICFVAYFIVSYKRLQSLKIILKGIPSCPTFPIVGSALGMYCRDGRDIFNKVNNQFKKHGGKFYGLLGNHLYVFMSEQKDIKAILTNKNMLDRPYEYQYLKPWLGDSIFIADGDKWKLKMKQYYPFLNMKFVENSVPVFEYHSKNIVKAMQNNMEVDFNIYHNIESFAMDVINELTLGNRNNSHENPTNFQHNVNKNVNITMSRLVHPIYRNYFLFSFTQKFKESQRMTKECRVYIQESIERTKKKGSIPLEEHKIFVDHLYSVSQASLPMNDEQMQDDLLSFIFAGLDTMTSALTFLIYCLAKYPEVQEKVYQEIKENINPKEALTIHSLNTLRYTNLVIREVLRMYPPGFAVFRTNPEALVLNGYTYPVNTTFVLSFYNAHHSSENYPDPEKFLPERHDVTKSVENDNIFNFFAFAPGVRSCRGNKIAEYEMKTFIVKMLTSYKIVLKEGFEPELSWDIVIKPFNGMWVKLLSR
ncbi:cytochrome P450 4d2-like [Culicoides brevitarsis]|uniref:cytochrome P450 4d2-like n=1 Tax=Culicoides brevitarsis TaxID=469753 RepID=UPI00307B4BA6